MSKETADRPVSAFSLFTVSKELVVKNYETYALVLLVPFLMSLFFGIQSSTASEGDGTYMSSTSTDTSAFAFGGGMILGIVVIVTLVLSVLASYALNYMVTHDKKPSVQDLLPIVRKFGWRLIGLSLVTGILIVFGIFAFIIPGIIFIRRYFLAPYVMIDQDLSITKSMEESARISKPFSGAVWGIIGVTILLSLVGIIPFFGWLLSFLLTTLYSVAPALRYKELKKLAPKA